jgi:hypothetical protein
LAIRFQKKGFLNKSTNQKEELPVVAMFVNRLLTVQGEMSYLYSIRLSDE